MMKKYEIEINDEVYRVAVKELSADADMSSQKNEEETIEEPETKETEVKTAPISDGTGTTVHAPMPGTIMSINVSSGDSVSQGDVLMILEAMKMENEIIAPSDGVVADILVNTNDSVKSDQALLKI